jgi:tRNA(adenine34) deaminase
MSAAKDAGFMAEALRLARQAGDMGEVPVGAVVVLGDKIIGRGYNRRETDRDPLSHAEINAIREASAHLGDWRLSDCTLYVTLEPCPMCTGAIINARIGRVVWGADDPKAGCFGSVCSLCEMPFNHRPRTTRGCMAEESSALLSAFFARLRD